jgi:hypothetical protein
MESIEKTLTSRLDQNEECRFVGRIRSSGKWQSFFYGDSMLGFDGVTTELMAEWPNQESATAQSPDPEWDHYFSILFPGDERLQWILTKRCIAELEKKGDCITEERFIKHLVSFPNHDAATAFTAAIQTDQFSVELVESTSTSKAPAAILVVIQRMDTLELESLHRTTLRISGVAKGWDGEYDGWESPVCKGTPPSNKAV